jgi:hypothetical protein
MSGTKLARDEWVRRVLGVALAPSQGRVAGADPNALKQTLAAYIAAQAAVDQQIAQLQAKLRGSADPALQRIGEFGLNALTGNTRVKAQAAVMELRQSLPQIDPKAAANASRMVAEMADHLLSDAKVRACDNNPLGVRVAIASTLGAAARQLHLALNAHAA